MSFLSSCFESVLVAQSCLTWCSPRLKPTRLLCQWDSPGKTTGEGCHSLPQGIFPTQELNPGLLHCRQILYCQSQQGSTAAAAAESLQPCPTLCDPIDGSPPGPPSLGFSRQEHWSGLPVPSPMHESEK